jgi:hypothetical protein
MSKELEEQIEERLFKHTCNCCGCSICQCKTLTEEEQKASPILGGRWDWYGESPTAWWEDASPETREMAFLAVTALMHKAELQHKGSYRWALYNVFGFDEGMYVAAMEAGYMDIHNALVRASEEE